MDKGRFALLRKRAKSKIETEEKLKNADFIEDSATKDAAFGTPIHHLRTPFHHFRHLDLPSPHLNSPPSHSDSPTSAPSPNFHL